LGQRGWFDLKTGIVLIQSLNIGYVRTEHGLQWVDSAVGIMCVILTLYYRTRAFAVLIQEELL